MQSTCRKPQPGGGEVSPWGAPPPSGRLLALDASASGSWQKTESAASRVGRFERLPHEALLHRQLKWLRGQRPRGGRSDTHLPAPQRAPPRGAPRSTTPGNCGGSFPHEGLAVKPLRCFLCLSVYAVRIACSASGCGFDDLCDLAVPLPGWAEAPEALGGKAWLSGTAGETRLLSFLV